MSGGRKNFRKKYFCNLDVENLILTYIILRMVFVGKVSEGDEIEWP